MIENLQARIVSTFLVPLFVVASPLLLAGAARSGGPAPTGQEETKGGATCERSCDRIAALEAQLAEQATQIADLRTALVALSERSERSSTAMTWGHPSVMPIEVQDRIDEHTPPGELGERHFAYGYQDEDGIWWRLTHSGTRLASVKDGGVYSVVFEDEHCLGTPHFWGASVAARNMTTYIDAIYDESGNELIPAGHYARHAEGERMYVRSQLNQGVCETWSAIPIWGVSLRGFHYYGTTTPNAPSDTMELSPAIGQAAEEWESPYDPDDLGL